MEPLDLVIVGGGTRRGPAWCPGCSIGEGIDAALRGRAVRPSW